jgi:hypothetical protein
MPDALSNGWAYGQQKRRPSTEKEREWFNNHPRTQQDRLHRVLANVIYQSIFGEVEIQRIDEMQVDDLFRRALDELGVDYCIVFDNGTLLSGQEKYLSYKCRTYNTVTISVHSWNHCAAQIYFCGYLTEKGDGFDPWAILDWAKTMMATSRGKIHWALTDSHDRYPSFYGASLDLIPKDCIIASYGIK